MKTYFRSRRLLGSAFCLLLPTALHAQTIYTWLGTTSPYNWSQAANWNGGVPVSSADTALLFNGAGGASIDNLTNPFTLNALTFGTGAQSYQLSGGQLNFANSTAATPVAPTLTVSSAAGQTINNALNFANATTVAVTGGALYLGGSLTGAGFTKKGTGTLTLGTGSSGAVNVALNANTTIDVQAGVFIGGSNNKAVWTNNLANLNVAGGAFFDGVEADVIVGGLSGAGVVRGGYGSSGSLTVGAGDAGGTFAGTLADSGNQGGKFNLVKIGGTPQILTGTNTYTGTTTVNFGQLIIGNGGTAGTLGSGAVVTSTNGVLQFNRSDTVTVANAVSGTGRVAQAGPGDLILTGDNTHSGGVLVTNGRLGVGSASALGTGYLGVTNGAVFAAGADADVSNAVSLFMGTLTVGVDPAGARNLTLSGVIRDEGNLVVNAPGATLTLSGTAANTFTGATSVAAGTLVLAKSGVSAINGSLTAGKATADPAAGTAPAAIIRQASGGQFAGGTAVTIFADGELNLGAASNSPGAITMTGGVLDGSAPFTLGSDITINASTGGARIATGEISLTAPRTFNVPNGAALYDLNLVSDLYDTGTGGAVVKTGPGTMRLDGARRVAVTVNAGTLAVTPNSGSNGRPITLAGGTLAPDGGFLLSTAPLTVTGNAALGTSVDGTAWGVSLLSPVTLNAGATLTVRNAGQTTLRGVTGDGALVKAGGGTLTLSLAGNTFNGGLTVNGGTVNAVADSALGGADGAVIVNAGTLNFTANTVTARTLVLGSGGVLATSGGTTLTYGGGASVNGGFLAGGGTHAFTAGSSLGGTTTAVGSTVTTAGAVSFAEATLRGALTVGADSTLAASDTLVVGSGVVTVNGTLNSNGLVSNGLVVVNSGGKIGNGGLALTLAGGSRTTINTGGTLFTAGAATIELNGALLVNNGTQTGTVNANYGSTVKGAGAFGTVNVRDGGRFSPGNSPGTATVAALDLGAAGSYDFELRNATGTVGVDSDTINVQGTLSLSGGMTANSRFVVSVISLDATNGAGMTANFDPAKSYRFTLVSAGGITGFDPNEFAVDASLFQNPTNGGSFSVVQDGSSLVLQFTPVPEPGTWVLLGMGGLLLGFAARRRARGVIR